eukprot:CAMPEP_0178973274 /NCGR_PEP_ID=MMETSP0789-20121207/21628_1 /TAXON_ID=3005 /ORGANISM="Rhizosolenia setigera, Strain CCMP 1694" /LENGTH=260 /DNA_ID=CAMNT_0020661115 /DNA_START=99 /DNA_END=881 /DNA_ORIENTATION=-
MASSPSSTDNNNNGDSSSIQKNGTGIPTVFQRMMENRLTSSQISAPYHDGASVYNRPFSSIITTTTSSSTSTSSSSVSSSNNNNNNHSGIEKTKQLIQHLPFPIPYKVQSQNMGTPNPDPTAILTESCGNRAAGSIVMGGAMGLVFGVFMGAMSDMTPPVTVINGKEVPQAPLKEQMRTVVRATGEKSLYWGRQFAFITGVFSGSECLAEKVRGKSDVWNEVISGCVTGAAMQGKSGPQAAAMGCGGFAAFSLLVHPLMH